MATRALSSRRPGKVERVGSARLRVISMLAVAIVLAGMVWSRPGYWQGVQHGPLAVAAPAPNPEVVWLPPPPGALFHPHLTPLVLNTTGYSRLVSPDQGPPSQR